MRLSHQIWLIPHVGRYSGTRARCDTAPTYHAIFLWYSSDTTGIYTGIYWITGYALRIPLGLQPHSWPGRYTYTPTEESPGSSTSGWEITQCISPNGPSYHSPQRSETSNAWTTSIKLPSARCFRVHTWNDSMVKPCKTPSLTLKQLFWMGNPKMLPLTV